MTEIINRLLISLEGMIMAFLNPLFVIPFAILLIVYILESKKYKAGAYYQVTHIPFLRVRRDIGKYGEYLTYKQLRHFEKNGAKFLFNVYVPKEDGETTEIDVLMITHKGIFVFESKNYSGWIFGNENRKDWYQTLPSGRGKSHKEHFYNPIMQNRTHLKHLQVILDKAVPMFSVIVFSDRCTLKDVTVNNGSVKVVNRSRVSLVVSEICKELTEDALSDKNISDLYNTLHPYTQVDEMEKQQHITNIAKKLAFESAIISNTKKTESISDAEETIVSNDATKQQLIDKNKIKIADDNLCPQCGGKLILRTATKGMNAGKQFWGCSNFPKCRYIKNVQL